MLSGQKYGILVSDNISVDGLAQAMSQLIKEYDENIGAWETFATTSANQSITVTINGSPVTIPGIGKLAQKGSNGALAVADGGTGATTAEGSRTNLGLGSAATRNTFSSSGDLLSVGDLGIGTESPPNPASSDANNAVVTGVYYANGGTAVNYFSGYTALLTLSRLPTNKSQIQVNASGTIGARAYSGTWSAWVTHYNTANTTKSSDGTLKAASPVARIVASQEACQRADIAEDGFSWCGCGTANSEAEGVTLSRLDVGIYVLAGSAGLASEGWQLLPQWTLAVWGSWVWLRQSKPTTAS
ncbi:pyocin knob domain-containing protein [Enterobacter mori]